MNIWWVYRYIHINVIMLYIYSMIFCNFLRYTRIDADHQPIGAPLGEKPYGCLNVSSDWNFSTPDLVLKITWGKKNDFQWSGLREILQETPFLMGKSMVSGSDFPSNQSIEVWMIICENPWYVSGNFRWDPGFGVVWIIWSLLKKKPAHWLVKNQKK